MKQKFIAALVRMLSDISAWFAYLSALLEKQELSKSYQSLSPIDTADDDNNYFNALVWALKERGKQNIRNIALTGPYGSGKSSVLRSFQKKYTGRDLKFLNISLATFKEEGSMPRTLEQEQSLLRLIEISILQQIFFHERDENIPDSRFKKIKSFGKGKLFFTAIGVTLTVIALINFLHPYFIQSLFKDLPFSQRVCDAIFYVTRIVLGFALLIILTRSIRVLSSISINKVKVQDAEIGLSSSASKSVLNLHLDEILYFFEVTKYNVVVIEDLDRFNDTEIFTKLREINQLLNSSKKTSRKQIAFIYAVRDDMFKDKDRTKFFDFIIPVIPVINSSNSGEKFLFKENIHRYQLSESFIGTISFFVDDMRLLHNIMNEFFIYKQKLAAGLNSEKLLSVLLYKNIYPNDFTLLSQNAGIIYQVFRQKKQYVTSASQNLEDQIKSSKDDLEVLERTGLTSVRDLNRVYVLAALQRLPQFNTFYVDGRHVSSEEMSSEEKFVYLIGGNFTYQKWQQAGYQLSSVNTGHSIVFSELEKTVNDKPYATRKKEISDVVSGKIEKLKQKISALEALKSEVKNSSIRDLLKQGHLTLNLPNASNDQVELIRVLLTNGYIAEDYLNYISIFYEGSITRADHQFYVAVKTAKKLEPDYALNRIANVVTRLDPADFYSPFVLNYQLVDHLVKMGDASALSGVMSTLGNGSSESLTFIDNFIFSQGLSLSAAGLISALVDTNDKFWNQIETHETFTIERKHAFLKLIVENVEIQKIKKLSERSALKQFVENSDKFLTLSPKVEKLSKTISLLRPDFKMIDFENTAPVLLEQLLKTEDYEINIENLRGFLVFKKKYDPEKFEHSNFALILASGIPELIECITGNAEVYVDNVFVALKENNNETEESFLHLLNNPELVEKTLRSVARMQKTRVSKIRDVMREDIRTMLMEESSVLPTWENMFSYYDSAKQETLEVIIDFINLGHNAIELAQDKPEGTEHYQFYKTLLTSGELELASFTEILKANNWLFEELSLDDLDDNKVRLLISDAALDFSEQNLAAIRLKFPKATMGFLAQHKDAFVNELGSLVLSSSEVSSILLSNSFTSAEKTALVKQLDETILLQEGVIRALAQALINERDFFLSNPIVSRALLSTETGLKKKEKILVFNARHNQVNFNEITDFLKNLGEPYSELAPSGKRPLLENTLEHRQLLATLQARSYISSFKIEKDQLRVVTRLQ